MYLNLLKIHQLIQITKCFKKKDFNNRLDVTDLISNYLACFIFLFKKILYSIIEIDTNSHCETINKYYYEKKKN